MYINSGNESNKMRDFIKDFTQAIQSLSNFKPDLLPGATTEDIKQAEKELQLTLPADFVAFYQVYNGQNDYADALFDVFFLCSFKKICQCWDAFKFNESDFLQIKAEAEPGIQNCWACSKWLPFASTADGHYLCLDFAPTKAGTVGQVITFWYNSPERELIAPSFKDFIVDYTNNIFSGNYLFRRQIFDETILGSVVRKDNEPMFGS